MRSADNSLVIVGQLTGSCETRTSPAGVAISRFVLQHHSGQMEAGIPREARCRIPVIACGEPLARAAAHLTSGLSCRVRGFISRANDRQGEFRLVLHATSIEVLESESSELPEG